jgi:hypothetical protein
LPGCTKFADKVAAGIKLQDVIGVTVNHPDIAAAIHGHVKDCPEDKVRVITHSGATDASQVPAWSLPLSTSAHG